MVACQIEIFCSIFSITLLRIYDYSSLVQVVAINRIVLIQLSKTKGVSSKDCGPESSCNYVIPWNSVNISTRKTRFHPSSPLVFGT